MNPQRAFSSARLVTLFNEWMRRFTDEPERFRAEFKTVNEFLKEDAAGKEPTYGSSCAEYLGRIDDDLAGRKPAATVDTLPHRSATDRAILRGLTFQKRAPKRRR